MCRFLLLHCFLSLEHYARIIESSKTSRSSRLSSNATNFSRRSYTFTTSDREAKSSLTDSEKVLLLFSSELGVSDRDRRSFPIRSQS